MLFVESDDASFVTGHILAVDGVKWAGRTNAAGRKPDPAPLSRRSLPGKPAQHPIN
jgi:hypothetical protein